MPNSNDTRRQRPPRSAGPWSDWGPRKLLLVALLLTGCNFLLQTMFYQAGLGLFVPVLLGAIGGVLIPLYLLCRDNGWSLVRDFGIDRPSPAILTLSALFAAAALAPTSLLAEMSLRLFPVDPEWESLFQEALPESNAGLVLAFFTVVVVGPLAEEIIFRGLLQRIAVSAMGVIPGVLLAAVVFGGIHGEPWYLFGLVGVGLMLAFIFEATHSITACWVAHGVHNAVSLAVMTSTDAVVGEPSDLTANDALWAGGSLLLLVFLGKVLWSQGLGQRQPRQP